MHESQLAHAANLTCYAVNGLFDMYVKAAAETFTDLSTELRITYTRSY